MLDITIPDDALFRAPSDSAQSLIKEADWRVEQFTKNHRPRIDNFVICDFPLVDAALAWIVEQNLLAGESFCEWGCGAGVVTMLAAMHQLNAHGIEVEPALIELASQLAEDFDINAEFVLGSFIPQGTDIDYFAQIDHVETDSPEAYDELGLDIADFDLIFAFPWPGEHDFFEHLFENHASTGALLLTYQGIERLRLQRKE